VEKGPTWPATVSEVTGGRRSGGGGTQAGRLVRTGGDGFNARAGEKESEEESARSCT
jgi:hypothetical protein